MGKMRGKIFMIIIASMLQLYGVCMYGGIRLEMRASDDSAHNEALVGQPFMIDVIIDEVQGSVQAPHIDGLEKMNARRTGMYMSSINGVSTTKYTYQVRIDKPGKYIIGPARLKHQQQEFVSNTLSIVIEQESTGSRNGRASKQKKGDAKAFLRLTIDADHVVVGQKMTATLKFYYQDTGISLTNIGVPDIPDFDVKPAEKPTGGSTDMNGVHYKYAEWRWHMYPKKAGEYMIPAYNVDYEIPSKDTRMMSGLFMFMHARSERKRVYSNATKVTVDALPAYEGEINAIGVFDDFCASITPAMAKEGEGMVLTLELCGNGNMDDINISALCIPEQMKYYHSQVSIMPDGNHHEWYKKKFEFIVQGIQVGDWEIPEQPFVYFDIQRQEYVTLKSSPLSVSIKPLNAIAMDAAEKKIDENNAKYKAQDSVIAPLNHAGQWYPVADGYAIPWIIFYCMLCLPMLYVGYPRINQKLFQFNCVKRWYKKRICARARKIIQNDVIEHNYVIYQVIIEVFSCLTEKRASTISCHDMEIYLKQQGFTQEDIAYWRAFYNACEHVAYAQAEGQKHELSRMAIQWLNRLEKAL